MSLSPELRAKLAQISTATLTTVLLKKGVRRSFMAGPKPISQLLNRPDQSRVVGEAFTLRFVPAREDLATPESWASPRSTRGAIEEMPEGCICVADAMGITEAGIFGDILCARMNVRKVAALVTDGSVRDADGVVKSKLPVWCTSVAAPASVAGLTFVNWQEPIGCGGIAVFPGDIIVADNDGAVCVPQAMVEAVAEEAVEQEAFENWAMEEVMNGAKLPGLYPPNEETKARYAAFRKKVKS
jgi:regulator of RNase E activity RraA